MLGQKVVFCRKSPNAIKGYGPQDDHFRERLSRLGVRGTELLKDAPWPICATPDSHCYRTAGIAPHKANKPRNVPSPPSQEKASPPLENPPPHP